MPALRLTCHHPLPVPLAAPMQILAMEKLMLNTLQFNLTLPTSHNFLARFIKAAGNDRKVRRAAWRDAVPAPLYGACSVEACSAPPLSPPPFLVRSHATPFTCLATAPLPCCHPQRGHARLHMPPCHVLLCTSMHRCTCWPPI